METINTYTNENNEFVFVTEFGEFTKKRTGQVPGGQFYRVTKLSGEWPDKHTLGAWVDARYMYLGGSVDLYDETASVSVNS